MRARRARRRRNEQRVKAERSTETEGKRTKAVNELAGHSAGVARELRALVI